MVLHIILFVSVGGFLVFNKARVYDFQKMLREKNKSQFLGCLPSLFILGVGKAGTTEMHSMLTHHHHIQASSRKEMT